MSRTRRKRRQLRAELKHGREARPRHQLQAGRTGGVHRKRTAPKRREPYVSPTAPRSIAAAARCWCGAGPGELHRHG